jgi:hypothetical protein
MFMNERSGTYGHDSSRVNSLNRTKFAPTMRRNDAMLGP